MLEDMLSLKRAFSKFSYPKLYFKVIELNLVNYGYWYLMNKDQVLTRKSGLLERYPSRNLIPFARRDDNDDIACFELAHGKKVFIVHDFASEGWERRQEFDSFWTWFISAINELTETE
ncbi:MAG: hypothetical protein FWH57_08520 [Oscillospiraceae bacterium]|nr:hypothetical protein [Oscillospiraceae bacterium]